MTTAFVFGMVVVLLLDGILSAARSALTRLQTSRHPPTSSGKPQQLELVNEFISHYSQTDASLAAFQMASRLVATGFFAGF